MVKEMSESVDTIREITDYELYKELVETKFKNDTDMRNVEYNWLNDSPDMQYEPQDRVLIILPLAVFELKRNKLSEEMYWEVLGSKDDLDAGLLDVLPIEELTLIRDDIEYCIGEIKHKGIVYY